MSENWIIIALGGLFALFLGRSAIIAIWPDSDAAKYCEGKLGFMDSIGDGMCDGDADGSDGDGGD